MSNRILLAGTTALVFGGVLGMAGERASAQTADPPPPVLLVLDKDALDYGPPPHLLPDGAVDPTVAAVGVREELPYFQSHLGSQVVLTGGQNGSDGWFALRSVPASWSTGESPSDGLENFALAGPGLGSPDDNGDRESLLDSVPDVTPVRADGLALLVGQTVCAVVYGGDVVVTPGSPSTASLKGPALGRVAFSVISVLPTDDAAHPNVQVQIAEGHEVCLGQLVPFAQAPVETP
jgi:hypothetical protein